MVHKFCGNAQTLYFIELKYLKATLISTTAQIKQTFNFSSFRFRSSRPEVFYEKVILEISQNSHENTCARVSFLINFQAQVSKISKNSFFYRAPAHRWLLLSFALSFRGYLQVNYDVLFWNEIIPSMVFQKNTAFNRHH